MRRSLPAQRKKQQATGWTPIYNVLISNYVFLYLQNEREYKIGCKLMQSFFTSVKVKPIFMRFSSADLCYVPGKVPSNRARVSAG